MSEVAVLAREGVLFGLGATEEGVEPPPGLGPEVARLGGGHGQC